MSIFSIIGSLIWAFLSDRAELAAEMVALRHQLAILQLTPDDVFGNDRA